MSAGFQVIDPNGVIVVDENNVCLTFRQKGTRTANNSAPFWVPSASVYYDDVTYSGGDAPVFAIHKPAVSGRADIGAGLWGSSYNAGTNTWTFRVLVTGNAYLGSVDYSYTYYIFDRPPAQPSGNGIEVYDANAKMVFSSHYQQLKMKPSNTTLPSGTYAHTYPATVSTVNDTRDEVDSFGNVTYWNVYRVSVTTYACTATGVTGAGIESSADGSDSWFPSGIESNASGGDFIVDVAGL